MTVTYNFTTSTVIVIIVNIATGTINELNIYILNSKLCMKSETADDITQCYDIDINLEYNTVGGHVKKGCSLPNFLQNSRGIFKINGGNVTSRRGSRRRDGASIVTTSSQCRSYGIGPLDRR